MSGVSNHYDAMTAIKAIIDGLSLSGLTGGCMIQEMANFQTKDAVNLPFVSVSPYGPEKVQDENNAEDGVGYGVLVAILANKDVNALETRLGWRQSMRRALFNRSLSVAGCYVAKVEPGNVIEPAAYWANKGVVSGFVVRCQFQEPRP